MSTRSNIVLQQGDELAYYYHHFDGYPSHMVPILLAARDHLEADDDFEVTKARFLAGVNLIERAWYAFTHDPERDADRRENPRKCGLPGQDKDQFEVSEHGLGEGPPNYVYRIRVHGKRLIEVCAGNGRPTWDDDGPVYGFKDPGRLEWCVVMPGDDLQRLQEELDGDD